MIVPNFHSAQTEITMEKIDRVTKTIGGKINQIAKFFGVILSWCLINLLIAVFISRTRSLSLETYRFVNESLRQASAQDLSILVAFIFENKLWYSISLAVIFAFSIEFFLTFLNKGADTPSRNGQVDRAKCAQTACDKHAFVVSYKQHVAFLS